MFKRIFFSISFIAISLVCNATMYGLFYGTNGNDLNCPENDVTDLAELYRKNGGQVILVIGDGVTKSNVIDGLKKQAAAATENDILVFVYSGHGNDGYIACGNNHVNFSDIKRIMSGSRARRKLVIIDACYSGSFSNTKHGTLTGENVIVITASRRNEESGELMGAKNSFFFEVLLAALNGKADDNNDGVITAKEFYSYAKPIFEGSKYMHQHPTMKGRFNENTILYTYRKGIPVSNITNSQIPLPGIATPSTEIPNIPTVNEIANAEQEAIEGIISKIFHKITSYLTWGNFFIVLAIVGIIVVILRYIIAYKLLMKYL